MYATSPLCAAFRYDRESERSRTVIRTARLVRLIARDIEDFALDRNIAETAVNSYMQLSVNMPHTVVQPGLESMHAYLCIVREILWR